MKEGNPQLDENNMESIRKDGEVDADFPGFIEPNDIIKVPHRFNIMLILFSRGPQNFTTLRKLLNLTPGNMDHHLKKIVELGWIEERTVFAFRPIKIYEVTDEGRHEFYQYAKQIKDLLDKL